MRNLARFDSCKVLQSGEEKLAMTYKGVCCPALDILIIFILDAIPGSPELIPVSVLRKSLLAVFRRHMK